MSKITSVDILNTIRNNASALYQDRIPEATRTNIGEIGQALSNYQESFNEFTTTLINRIALTLFNANPYSNPLKKFKKGKLPYGKTIQDIFVELIKAENFDGEGEKVDKRRKPTVQVKYYEGSRKDKYPITISDDQVYEAFTSQEGVKNLAMAIMESMISSSEYDEFIMMKELLGKGSYYTYEVNEPIDNKSCSDFIKAVKKASKDISYMSNEYNPAHVKTHTPTRHQVLFINKDVSVNVDVELLSKAMDSSFLKVKPTIIELDDFGSLTDTYALLVDERAILVYDKLVKTTSRYNEDGLYTNIFLHIQQQYGFGNFKNAVRFGKPTTE